MRPRLDWGDIQVFAAIAQAGTLSGAAEQLGLTQPTVGRRLKSFETSLGTRLFDRRGVSLQLTPAGVALRGIAEQMDLAAVSAARMVVGRDADLAGHVVVTAPEWLSARVLAPAIAEFTALHPAIIVDLLGEPKRVSLTNADTDIALRLARFTEADVSQRCIATVTFALYASTGYIARHGYPNFDNLCEGHSIVALTHARQQVADVAWLAEVASAAQTSVRCNGRETQARLAQAGAGVACLPRLLGDATPGLELLRSPAPPSPQLWSGVHSETKDVPRVRALLEFLTLRSRRILF